MSSSDNIGELNTVFCSCGSMILSTTTGLDKGITPNSIIVAAVGIANIVMGSMGFLKRNTLAVFHSDRLLYSYYTCGSVK
jgi:hypothetical protein